MDPEACLVRAQEALNDSDWDECWEALTDYWNWRGRDGFMPENGDDRAVTIEREMNLRREE